MRHTRQSHNLLGRQSVRVSWGVMHQKGPPNATGSMRNSNRSQLLDFYRIGPRNHQHRCSLCYHKDHLVRGCAANASTAPSPGDQVASRPHRAVRCYRSRRDPPGPGHVVCIVKQWHQSRHRSTRAAYTATTAQGATRRSTRVPARNENGSCVESEPPCRAFLLRSGCRTERPPEQVLQLCCVALDVVCGCC